MSSLSVPLLDIPSRMKKVVAAAEDVQAVDLKVLDVSETCDFADYFLICGGTSRRQVQAIADEILERLREERIRPLHSEGQTEGQWVLLDYGDFIVHIFDEERRHFYRLERLWSDAPDATREFVQ